MSLAMLGGTGRFASSTEVALASHECINNGISNCTAAFFTPPSPNGMVWLYGISGVDEEDRQGPCTTSVRAFDEDRVSSPCDQPRVLVYVKRNPALRALFITAFAITLARAICELLGVYGYHRNGKADFFLTMADDGAAGPIYYTLIKVGCCGDKTEPTVPPYTLSDWFVIQVMEAIVNIAVPAVAIIGCKPKGLLTLAFVRLIGGIVKSVVMLFYNMYQRCRSDPSSDVVTNNLFHDV